MLFAIHKPVTTVGRALGNDVPIPDRSVKEHHAQIVFNGQPQNVEWTFVAGRALKANGKLVGVNMTQLLEDAQTAVDTHIAPAILP